MKPDRINAISAAADAAASIEWLQESETWLLLSPEIRREVCRSHALLAGLARTLDASTAAAEVVA